MTEALEVSIGKMLQQRRQTLAVGESCTGGLIGHHITNVPGSSEYFMGGVVSYAYEAKVNLLGVRWETLHAHGAVSCETVLEMARGVRQLLGADIGLAVSCIAGPGGATLTKSVGTSWAALVTQEGEWARHFLFNGDRLENKESLSQASLQLLLDYLQDNLS